MLLMVDAVVHQWYSISNMPVAIVFMLPVRGVLGESGAFEFYN